MKLHERLFFLLLLFLPTQLAYHPWPSFSYVLGRRVDYLSPALFATDLIVIGILVAWAYESRKRFGTRNMPTGSKKILFGTVGIVIVFAFFNSTNSLLPAVSIIGWIKVTEMALLSLYVLRKRPPLPRVILAVSVGVFFSSVIGLVQFVLQRSVGGILWWVGERRFDVLTPGIARLDWCAWPFSCRLLVRPYATFPHPNVLAGYLAVSLPLLVRGLATVSGVRMRFWYRATIALAILALVGTFSRSGWFAAAAGLTVALLTDPKTLRITQPVRVGVFAAAGSFLFLAVRYFPAAFDTSIRDRWELMNAAISLWSQHPFFGIGLHSFLIGIPGVMHTRPASFLQPVHSVYLLLLAETGVIGMGLLLVGLTAIVRSVWHDTRPVTLPLPAIGVIQLLLIGVVDHYPLTLQQGQLLLSVFVGLTLAYRKR